MSKTIKEKAEEILNRFSLKKTDLRIHLIELFLKKRKPLSQGNIIEELEIENSTIDRVSIYRNLNQLKAVGIIHEVENNKYVSCSHECEQHAHVLLFCQSCEKHIEIKDHEKLNTFFTAIDKLQFLSSQRAVFLKGICQSCIT